MIRFTQVLLCLFCFTQAQAAPPTWYVSPTGGGEGSAGTIGDPWNLVYAGSEGNTDVVWGGEADTFLLRGGNYTEWAGFPLDHSGTVNAPNIWKPYQNEKPVILIDTTAPSSGWAIYGSYNRLIEIEFNCTQYPDSGEPRSGIQTYPNGFASYPEFGPGNKFINCVFRNWTNNGLNMEDDSLGSMYGCIVYFNGRRNFGGGAYGVYIQNHRNGGNIPAPKRIDDCIFMNNFAGYQIHAYGTSVAVDSVILNGCVVIAQGDADMHPNIMFSSALAAPTGCAVESSFVYGKYESVSNGYNRTGLQERKGMSYPTFRNNYILQSRVSLRNSTTNRTFSNNVLYGSWPLLTSTEDEGGTEIDTTLIPGNQLHIKSGTGVPATKPANYIIVRPNAYKSNRAHLIVVNMDSSASVTVPSSEMAKICTNGDSVYFFDVQNYFGGAVDSGVWNTNDTWSLAIGNHTTLETPESIPDQDNYDPVTHTDRKFGVYVLLTNGDGGEGESGSTYHQRFLRK